MGQRLKAPKTGFSLGITDFGNRDSLGIAISAMPFIEFKAFGSEKWSVLTGMGASYFTKKFNEDTNPQNQAVTTDITWAFRMYLYYQFLSTKDLDWRLGLGYSHHSNGHTRLLNQGYNSFLVSLSADIKTHWAVLGLLLMKNFQSTKNRFIVISLCGADLGKMCLRWPLTIKETFTP